MLREQRGNDAPLARVPMDVGDSAPVLHHSGLEKSFDDAENVAVGNLGRRQPAMMTSCGMLSKKPLISASSTYFLPLLMEFIDPPQNSHVASSSRPETKRIVVKDPLKEWTQKLANHLLSNAVPYSGDAQGTGFAPAFVDVDSS